MRPPAPGSGCRRGDILRRPAEELTRRHPGSCPEVQGVVQRSGLTVVAPPAAFRAAHLSRRSAACGGPNYGDGHAASGAQGTVADPYISAIPRRKVEVAAVDRVARAVFRAAAVPDSVTGAGLVAGDHHSRGRAQGQLAVSDT